MGTVGINFGSATSGTGFNVAETVSAIQSSQAAIESPWKSQLSALQAQDTALSTIGTDLATLSTSLQKLTDFTGVTAQKDGSSSAPAVLTLIGATSAATAGSHSILVNTLAKTSSSYTDPVAAADVLSGNIQIQVGSGTAHTITLDSTNNTLATLKAAINSGSYGVTASIVSDASGSRLSLVSATGGQAGSLTVTSNLVDTTHLTNSAPTPIAATTAAGVNASLTVDGIPITSASNTVSTAVPGVTFQLLTTSVAPVDVEITNDTASVSTAISTLVTSYNAVVKDLKTQEGKDSNGNAEPLYGSPTLSLLQSQLSSAIFAGAASGGIGSVTQLGITFNNDGTLALNTDTLTTALTNNFSDIVGFLQNGNSFGQKFTTTLNSLGTSSVTGSIHVAQQQNASQEAALNKSIANEEALLATQKIALTAELNTANQILQAIPSQLDQINQIYSAVTGYNTKG